MKKVLAILMCAVLSALAFTGCGAAKEAADNVTQAMTDVSDAASEAASDMDETGQGDVTDDDGIIGNENETETETETE